MNYKDLQNISYLSQQILTESSTDHDAMNRWPYSSPYLNEEVIDEARAKGVKPYRGTATQAEVRADAAAARKKHVKKAEGQEGYNTDDKKFSDWKLKATPSSTLKRKKKEGGTEEETVSQRMDREHPYKQRMTGPMAREYGSRHAAEVTRVVRGPGEPQSVTYPRKKNEEFDIYDLVFSHLLDEGYAETEEAATAIMANMSEEWVESIVESMIVRTGTSTNAAGEQIPWTHTHNTATGRSSVKDKFGERDVTSRNPKLDRSSDKIKSDTMSRKKGARY